MVGLEQIYLMLCDWPIIFVYSVPPHNLISGRYYLKMNSQSVDKSTPSLQEQVQRLEDTVEELVGLCKRLSEENSTFKGSNRQLLHERSELQSRNDKVRTQVEAMVHRLKALDKSS